MANSIREFVRDSLRGFALRLPDNFASSSDPAMDGVASSGTSRKYSREDHVHPSDTSKADIVIGAIEGDLAMLDANGNLFDGGYSASDFATSVHTHGNIQNGGDLQTTDISIASGDKLVVTDASDSNKIARTDVTFDGSTTNTALTPKGTFERFLQSSDLVDIYTEGNGIDIDSSNVISIKVDPTTSNSNGLETTSSGLKLNTATQSSAGALSAADKIKLDGIATGAEVNVQSDWNQTDDTADDYIKNKPEVVDSVYHAGENINIRDIDPYGEYELLDYVYNSTDTGVDTGILPKVDDVEFEIRYRENSSSTAGYCTLFGCQGGGSTMAYTYGLSESSSTSNKFRLSYRSSSNRLTSAIDRVKGHTYTVVGTLKNGNATLYVFDETTGESDVQTGTYSYVEPSYNIKLLRRDYGPTYYKEVRIYRATLRVGGKVVLDYLPVKRKLDNVVGFLNSVTGTFIPATWGTLNAGAVAVGKKDYVIIPWADDTLSDGGTAPVEGGAIYNNIYPKLWNKQNIISLIGTKYPIVTGWYIAGNQFVSSENASYCVIPANDIRRIIVTSKTSNSAYLGFLSSYTPPDGNTPPSFTHCVGYGNRLFFRANRTMTFYVPDDASYIYILIKTDTGTNIIPSSVLATGTGITDIDDDYSDHNSRLYDESIKAIGLDKEIVGEYLSWLPTNSYIDIRTGKWAESTNYTSAFIPISPSIVKSVKITPPSSGNAARLAFLTEYPYVVDGTDAPLCSGTSAVSPTANEEYEAMVPSDAHWMLVYVGNTSYSVLPSSLKLTGVRAAEFAAAAQKDKHYTYEWATLENTITITHNLGKFPSVTIVDTAGSEIIGNITYIDINTVTLSFSSQTRGTAYFN